MNETLPRTDRRFISRRILIADDYDLARKGVRSVLEKRIDFQICGEATNGKEAVEKTLELKPDVVILDISMPVLNGFDAARIIRKSSPDISIIFVSVHDLKEIVMEAHNIGARGYVLKANAEQNLVKAVDAAVQDQTSFYTN